MSFAKRMMEEDDERREIATKIAIDAGVLRRCEYHGEVYDTRSGDYTSAYKLGNYLLSRGELGDSFSDSLEMTDAIKKAVEDAAMECFVCAKWKDE